MDFIALTVERVLLGGAKDPPSLPTSPLCCTQAARRLIWHALSRLAPRSRRSIRPLDEQLAPRYPESLKSLITQRLCDISLQKYTEYLDKESHPENCKIVRLIHGAMYEQREYLNNIKSPEISSFTKFRIDTNRTLGSLLSSFRNNKITNSTSACGECEHEVEPVLFNGKNKEIITICDHFEEKYCRHA